MSIKPDRWIRRMAREHGMIEPFVDRQVRKGAISYGVSSYGYDLRVSDQFKVFTDVYGAVVDPKNFDPKSFVDVKTDVCMVPPHSFALARSVEYFRIPRNVLTVCLGKCLTGDTRVVDAETGDYLPISEFAGRRRTVALDGWRTATRDVDAFVPQGRQPVFELRTRAGLRIKATANHPFRQLRGWTPLSQLRPGDRIAAARQVPVFGTTPLPEWEAALLGLMISEGQCSTPGSSPTFTNEDPTLVDLLVRCAREGLGCEVTHNGLLGYRIVNRTGRGGTMTTNRATAWLESHGAATKSAEKVVPRRVFTAPAESVAVFLRALFAGDGSVFQSGDSMFLEYYSMSRRLIEDVHHLLLRFGIVSLIRDKQTHLGTTASRVQITDRAMIARFAERIGFWPGSAKQFTLEHQIIPAIEVQGRSKSNFDTLPHDGWSLVRGAARRASRSLASAGIHSTSPSQSVPYSVAGQIAEATGDEELTDLVEHGPLWDVVESIVSAGVEETYDLSVPEVHNFLANDLIVHNSTYARCGIIVNVTPFEPEWEGHVTLEISNTTPLPCRIYANEGLAQVLFFESDEPCDVSYKDRKGKYQGQRGITLPRK